ncbi:MAG: molybdopterin-binding protein [Drouetiella hepatica Uher 2000/2452]|uniref:Molybdopterin-binding protein n=1 Tax=Drouetiella hepatica Uher 2000/2452 TaxID=904376 RepID=A0A951QEY4_9CYAN|nr:molybdopterin-binding protein [Drouetiella hepatica Uher 2000/2452]
MPLAQASTERSDQEEAIFEERLSENESLELDSELKPLKVSARNVLRGRVKRLILGVTSAEVIVEIASGAELVATITRASAEHLELSEGKDVYAVIKSSNIMIASD